MVLLIMVLRNMVPCNNWYAIDTFKHSDGQGMNILLNAQPIPDHLHFL